MRSYYPTNWFSCLTIPDVCVERRWRNGTSRWFSGSVLGGLLVEPGRLNFSFFFPLQNSDSVRDLRYLPPIRSTTRDTGTLSRTGGSYPRLGSPVLRRPRGRTGTLRKYHSSEEPPRRGLSPLHKSDHSSHPVYTSPIDSESSLPTRSYPYPRVSNGDRGYGDGRRPDGREGGRQYPLRTYHPR